MMPEIIPSSCYHLDCLKKSQEDMKNPRDKVLNGAKFPTPERKQVCVPLWEGHEQGMLAVYFDSLWCLLCVFITIILAARF